MTRTPIMDTKSLENPVIQIYGTVNKDEFRSVTTNNGKYTELSRPVPQLFLVKRLTIYASVLASASFLPTFAEGGLYLLISTGSAKGRNSFSII